MTVFQMKRYRKTADASKTPTDKTDRSHSTYPSGSFGGAGSRAHPEKIESTHQREQREATELSPEKTLESLKTPTAITAESPTPPPSGANGGSAPSAHPEFLPTDPFTIGKQPGHCGCCQHFTPNAPDFPEHFGTCTLGWVNHTGEQRKDPVYLTCHATCMARNGTAWKAKVKSTRAQE